MTNGILHIGTAKSYFAGNRHGTIRNRYLFEKADMDGENYKHVRACRVHLIPRRFHWKASAYRREQPIGLQRVGKH